MHARVYRLRHLGKPLDRLQVREEQPTVGDLGLRLRLLGRGPRANVYVATLTGGDDARYVIPALDLARVVEIKGRWLCLEGHEAVPRGRGHKNIHVDYYHQEWWCCIATRGLGA